MMLRVILLVFREVKTMKIFLLSIVFLLAGLVWSPVALATTIVRAPNNLNLVGYWPMNEGRGTQVGDFSGNGNHGSLGGDPQWTRGKRGGAMEFDGDSVILTASSNFIPSENNTLTITAWVKANSISASSLGNRIVNIHRGSVAGSSLALSLGSGNKVQFYNHSGLSTNSWVNNVSVGNWYFIALTYDGTSFQKYFNGNIDGSTITESLLAGGSYPAHIGSYDNSLSFFNGSIDDVRVYNRALTATEILALYNSGAVKMGVTPVGPASDALVSHWTFDGKDVSEATVTDRGPNGYNGTMESGVSSTLGFLGQALNFPGNKKVSIGTATILNEGSPLTVSAWLYLNGYSLSSNSVWPTFLGLKSSSGSPFSFSFLRGSSGYRGIFVGNSSYFYRTSGDISAQLIGRWRQATITYNGSGFSSSANWQIYLDGVLQSITTASSWNSGTNNNYIGGDTHSDDHWSGKIDDVRIYNRVLTASEISDLYNATKGSKVNATAL